MGDWSEFHVVCASLDIRSLLLHPLVRQAYAAEDLGQKPLDGLNPLPPTKDRITIRLDKDILAWFKRRVHEQGGGNYQTLINDALREYLQGHGTLEAILRRVIREELHQTGHSRVPQGAQDDVV
jgi:uncharacterized protein (DUF4415 family)